jgi:hypothetical protein
MFSLQLRECQRVFVFDPETKRAGTVVQIGFGRTEAGWWPALICRKPSCIPNSSQYDSDSLVDTL